MNDSERGTGRTQRGVVQAVCAMIMGKNVVHVSGTPQAARDACEYAKNWLKVNGFLDQTAITVATEREVIRFGTATLTFLPMSASLRGMSHDIIKDHFVLEYAAEKARQRARIADMRTIARLMHKHEWGTVELPAAHINWPTITYRSKSWTSKN